MVTISTRVRRFAGVLAIAERFPEVYCSVGTHPHYAHEELDVTAADLVARTRHPKVVAIGEAGLDYHYDNSPRDAQERGFRTHIAAARATGLPLVIHSREADADTARILEEETGKGAFPAVLHCFTGGPDLARRAVALGGYISFTGILTFKNSTALRAIAAEPAGRSHSGRDRRALSRARAVPRQAQRAGLCGRDREGLGRDARRFFRRDRAADVREFLPAVQQGAAVRQRRGGRANSETKHVRGMTLKFTILGCGSSGGVPRPALGWGACDPNNPKNRRRADLAAGRAARQRRRHARADRHFAGPARAAARRRRRLARRRVLHPRACRPHPRHRRPALAVHQAAPARRHLHGRAHRARSCANASAIASSRRPAASIRRSRPSIAWRPASAITITGQGGAITALPSPAGARRHSLATASASASFAYSCDLSGMPAETADALTDLDVWVVDALRYRPHPSHFSVADALSWIERLKPRRAILTNLHADLDYEVLRKELPPHVEPGFDGMTLSLDD